MELKCALVRDPSASARNPLHLTATNRTHAKQWIVLLAIGLCACASLEAAPTSSPQPPPLLPQRVQGEYVAGEAYRVQYVADETGFHANVRLVDGRPESTTYAPVAFGAGFATKPQDGDEIGCALRNSLCGK